MMSVPRPAMLVAIVTAPWRPASATMCGFFLVELGVEDLVRDAAALEQLREVLGVLDRDGADEHRLPGLVHLLDLLGDGVELALERAVDEVVLVLADHVGGSSG